MKIRICNFVRCPAEAYYVILGPRDHRGQVVCASHGRRLFASKPTGLFQLVRISKRRGGEVHE